MLLKSALRDPNARKEIQPEQLALLDHIARQGRIERDGPRVQLRLELTSQQIASLGATASQPSDR
jgi:hypothetical protein